MKVIATLCFPDEPSDHMKVLVKLLDYYNQIEGRAGETLVDVVCEDENLVIDVSKGFHCISIPIKKIKEILADYGDKAQ